jgi:hypothetical protein
VVRFDRDPATGALTFGGCISGEGGSAGCTQIPGATPDGSNSALYTPASIGTSGDGRSAYVGTFAATLARFDRDPATGGLTYRDCITAVVENAGCAQLPGATTMGHDSGLDSLSSIAFSPDDRSVYLTAENDAGLVRFDRVPEPVVIPPPNPNPVPPPVGLVVGGDKKQDGFKKILVTASCDSACSVTANGTIKLPAAAGKATLKLKPASADLAAGATTTLKLKLKGKTRRLTKAALDAGQKAKATISATASGAAGDSASATLKVKLKSK